MNTEYMEDYFFKFNYMNDIQFLALAWQIRQWALPHHLFVGLLVC